MSNSLIEILAGFCEDGCNLIIDVVFTILFVFMFILEFIVVSIMYDICRPKHHRRIHQNHQCLSTSQKSTRKLSNVSQNNSEPIFHHIVSAETKNHRNISLFSNPKSDRIYITTMNICTVHTVDTNKSINPVFPSIEERTLICYCDGSYSHCMKIGHFGFRASNGKCSIRFISPHDPKHGSTDTEVHAACLAIQYGLGKQYNELIIYTDNSKVEQLLKRPTKNDAISYYNICESLNRFQKQNHNNSIQVIQVRGHTSIDEQQKCKTKHKFAKIDQAVRKKTRQYIKRRRCINIEQTSYYWYQYIHYPYFPCTYRVLQYYI
ncbi:unnamed protein product [Rotaria socialis]|uniref:RNase H type-1 domain-containing protein n=2 Tax=Rotaria socialis TaxID=392032 RepID=A0A820XBK6_9BILA|nr:unnamed protein product [Rotaria socialis]